MYGSGVKDFFDDFFILSNFCQLGHLITVICTIQQQTQARNLHSKLGFTRPCSIRDLAVNRHLDKASWAEKSKRLKCLDRGSIITLIFIKLCRDSYIQHFTCISTLWGMPYSYLHISLLYGWSKHLWFSKLWQRSYTKTDISN